MQDDSAFGESRVSSWLRFPRWRSEWFSCLNSPIRCPIIRARYIARCPALAGRLQADESPRRSEAPHGWDTTNLTATSDAADFDRDGVSNLWEYIQGKNPAIPDSSATSGPKAAIANVGASNYLELTYERQSSLPPGVVIKVQFSNDLATWPVQAVVEGAAVGAGISVTTGSVSNGRRTITVRQSAPIGSGTYRFMRLSAEQVAP